VAAFVVASPRRFDVYVASIAGLAVNILLDAGLVELLFSHSRGEEVGKLMVMALAAAGLLAGTVRLIMLLSRNHSEAEDA
jgi:high-affinity Fe2+/Pb2+ permease